VLTRLELEPYYVLRGNDASKNTEPIIMTNRKFLASIAFTFAFGATLIGGCSSAHAAPLAWQAQTATGNPPSAARAQMARYNVPGGCVITTAVDAATGNLVRHSHCEYSPALRARLALTGR
jgi:hypothetical protein